MYSYTISSVISIYGIKYFFFIGTESSAAFEMSPCEIDFYNPIVTG